MANKASVSKANPGKPGANKTDAKKTGAKKPAARRRRPAPSAKKGKFPVKYGVLAVAVILAALSFMMLPEILLQFIRLFAFAGFVFAGYFLLRDKNWLVTALVAACAMLFQPVGDFAGGKMLWNVIDILLIIVILYALYRFFAPKRG